MGKRIPVLVAASGGIDSTALIHRYLSEKEVVRAIHFDYGQPSRRSEREAVGRACRHYRVKVTFAKLGIRMLPRGYELLGRNALFVIAGASMGPPPLRVSLGIHRGPEYYDVTPRFVSDMQRVLDGYFGGTVVLEAPFLSDTKKDIVDYCKRKRVPLHMTYSCQKKNAPPCGRCPSCLDRQRYLGSK